MLIGIDGSTVRTGFAVGGAHHEKPRTGVWTLPGAADHVFDRTLGTVATSLAALIRITKATHVVVESPIMVSTGSNAHSIASLMQLYGAIRATVHQTDARFLPVHSATVRKFFIGRGNLKSAEAEQQIEGRCVELGWECEDHNARDAAATWAWGMSQIHPEWSNRLTPLFRDAAE